METKEIKEKKIIIIKDIVPAISCSLYLTKKSYNIMLYPLSIKWDDIVPPNSTGGYESNGYCGEIYERFENEEEIKSIIPAPPNSFQIWASSEDSEEWICLGFEFQGAYHPDWFELAYERIYKEKV